MKDILLSITDSMMQKILFNKAVEENCVAFIIERRFKIDTRNMDDVRTLIKSKKLKLVYSYEGKLLGVSSNNRWLYTLSGQIIGKDKNRFRIEDII